MNGRKPCSMLNSYLLNAQQTRKRSMNHAVWIQCNAKHELFDTHDKRKPRGVTHVCRLLRCRKVLHTAAC